jgi:hypothetical protein
MVPVAAVGKQRCADFGSEPATAVSHPAVSNSCAPVVEVSYQ